MVLDVAGNSEFRVPDASEDFKALATKAAAEEEHIIGLPAARRSYLARETKGRSVATFFRSLLAARLPAEGGLTAAGTGSEVDGGAPADLPVPPGVAAADQKADAAVSFDDFFGSEREGSTPLRQRAEPGKDDLDQFQTWLQNLKR